MAVVLLISVAYALCGYAMVFAWHLFVLRGERYDPDYFKCKANRASIITAPAFGIFLGGFMFIFALCQYFIDVGFSRGMYEIANIGRKDV